jgi:hypothetical protein
MAVHFPNVKATFIHVPKTGGTSFYDWISRNITDYDQQPNNNFKEGSVLGATAQWGDLGTVFSFARNPYSRLVSMYLYQYEKAKDQLKRKAENPAHQLAQKYTDYLKTISISAKGFDHWLECLCYNKNGMFTINDAHPNQVSVSSWYNGIIPNIIIKTENLNKEFYKISNLLTDGKSTEPLPWINTTHHKQYQDYYNSKTKQLVSERFKDDLELFEYKF